MTRRINQKLADKRKAEEEKEAAKDAKKAKKIDAVKKEEEEAMETESVQKNSCLIVDRLKGSHDQSMQALAELARCSAGKRTEADSDVLQDSIDDFLAGGGTASHLLHVLDSNPDKNKANDLAAVFNAVEAVVLRLVHMDKQDSPSFARGPEVGLDLAKRVSADYGKELVLLLSGTNTAYQAKSVLRMLTAMVTLGAGPARELLAKLNWDHDNWDTLHKRSSRQDPPDVRTCFIHFLLSFLFESNPLVLKDFFNTKTRLSSVLAGLVKDPADTVQLVLETLKTRVLTNSAVSKTNRMKLFGSHNIKALLGLVKWTGPKKMSEEDDDLAEREVVRECVATFLGLLLGSQKHGVVFHDPEFGSGDKVVNPLVRELLLGLGKPWEEEGLVSVVVNVLTACPDQLPSLLQLGQESWSEVRDSDSWHKAMDLLLAVIKAQDPEAMSGLVRPSGQVVKAVVSNILLPTKLVSALAGGLQGQEVRVSASTKKCLELLASLSRNAAKFVSGLTRTDLKKNGRFACKEVFVSNFPSMTCLMEVWSVCLEQSDATSALRCLQLMNFRQSEGGDQGQGVEVGKVLQDVERNRDNLGQLLGEVQLEALKLFHHITSESDQETAGFLVKLCTEEIFRLLLENILFTETQEHMDISSENDETLAKEGSSQAREKKETSQMILICLVKGTDICFKSGEDLDLLLALLEVRKETVGQLPQLLVEVVQERQLLSDQLLSLSFDQLRLRSEEEGQELQEEKLFQSLLDPDFTEGEVTAFVSKEETESYFSPLVLSLIKNNGEKTELVESFIKRLVFLFEDVHVFCSLLKDLTSNLSEDFKAWLNSLVCSLTSSLKVTSKDYLPSNKDFFILVKAEASRLLHLSYLNTEFSSDLLKLLENTSPTFQTGLLRSLLSSRTLVQKFSPYSKDGTPVVGIKLLIFAKQLDIYCPELKKKFLTETKNVLESKSFDVVDNLMVIECFKYLQLNFDDLHSLFSLIIGYPVNDFLGSESDNSSVLRGILTGFCEALSLLDQEHLDDDRLLPLMRRLGCLLEVLLDNCSGLGGLANSLRALFELRPVLCEQAVSENLVLVCLKEQQDVEQGKEYLLLAGTLVKKSRKQLDAFKSWILEDKTRATERLWPVFPRVFENPGFQNEKKFVTILLKNVVDKIQKCFTSPEGVDYDLLLEIARHLCHFSKSEKQLELWTRSLGDKVEKVEDSLNLPPSLLLAKCLIISTIHKISGGLDTRIMKEAFLPLIHQIGLGLRASTESDTGTVLDLCTAANECKELVENKIFVKEIGKNTTVWEKFYRNVLKFSLKLDKSEGSVAALKLFSSICEFLMAGGKLTNPDTIVDMVQSHSQYLSVLLGSPSDLKTSLVGLLLSLSPSSCRVEQVPLLLAGYSASLHPSDQALLCLLHQHELQGVELAQFQPFVFGPPAVAHYSPSGGWKAPKASELLALLNSDQIRRTSLRFPLLLPLDPAEEVSDGVSTELGSDLYDPRFLLPFLSHLLDPASEAFMDKHMRLVDSGVLGLAIAATSSALYGVRAAGYHLLHSIHRSLSRAKLANEKVVWLHLIMLIRQGLSTSPKWSADKRCVRLPSLLTVFLIKTVEVLLNPMDSLYRPVSRSILAKPALDLATIPEFSRLLNSSDATNSRTEQRWLLDLLKTGVRDNIDYDLVKRNFATKILMSQWSSCLLDRVGHLQVLDVVESCVGTNFGCLDLLTKQGLLSWLSLVVSDMNTDKAYIKKVVNILEIIMKTVKKYDKRMVDEGQDKVKIETIIDTELRVLVKGLSNYFRGKKEVDQLKLLSERFTFCDLS